MRVTKRVQPLQKVGVDYLGSSFSRGFTPGYYLVIPLDKLGVYNIEGLLVFLDKLGVYSIEGLLALLDKLGVDSHHRSTQTPPEAREIEYSFLLRTITFLLLFKANSY